MYIKTTCPICGDGSFHHVRFRRKRTFLNGNVKTEITAVEITDTCSQEELASSVLHELASHVYDGIETREICKILKEKFGVFEQYCCDIVQQLKYEMKLYSPDRQHLYFV